MYKIAICGTMGSGKSTVSELVKRKYPVFNCDNEAKKCYEDDKYLPLLERILETNIIKDNQVDYKLISNIIFNDENKRKQVETIIHEYVLNKINNLCEDINFVEIPLLYELGWDKYFDSVILVATSQDIAIDRIIKTRNITQEEALKRLQLQIANNIQKEKVDYTINNDGSYEELKKQVVDIIRKIEERYGVKR